MNALANIASVPAPTTIGPEDLVTLWLAGRRETTVRAYARDIGTLAAFMGADSPARAIDMLTSLPCGPAHAVVIGWRASMAERGLAPATIARRLAAVRSVVKLARTLGRCPWSLEVEGPRVETYRDTRGPGRDGWRAVLDTATSRADGRKGRRDLAIIRLLHDLALRCSEVTGLDLEDLDLGGGVVMVRGKGRADKAPLTLPAPTRAALADWLAVRGESPGALFTREDGMILSLRLTSRGAHKMIAELGRAAGLSRPLRPHGLRHQGITAALDATGGDVRTVRTFSRHAKLDTLLIYDDRRKDAAGVVAELVANE